MSQFPLTRTPRILAPIAWMALLWVLSSIPAALDQTMAGVFVPKVLQKTMHVVAYAVLAATWLWVFDSGRVTRAAAISVVSLASTYAAIDEFHQTFVPGRTGSPWDVGLDTFGAALGVFVVAAIWGAVTPTTAAAASRG
jgi:VanZ like family